MARLGHLGPLTVGVNADLSIPWGEGPASGRFGFPDSDRPRHQMQPSNESTPIANNIGTIFVTIELSQKSWLVTMHSPERDRMSRHKVEGGDHAGLLALI